MTWKLCMELKFQNNNKKMKIFRWLTWCKLTLKQRLHVWQLQLKSVHCTNNESRFHISFFVALNARARAHTHTRLSHHCNRKSNTNLKMKRDWLSWVAWKQNSISKQNISAFAWNRLWALSSSSEDARSFSIYKYCDSCRW